MCRETKCGGNLWGYQFRIIFTSKLFIGCFEVKNRVVTM